MPDTFIGCVYDIVLCTQTKNVATKPNADLPKVNQNSQNLKDDLFSDLSLLDPAEDFRHEDVAMTEKDIEQKTVTAALQTAQYARFFNLLSFNNTVLQTELSSGSPMKRLPSENKVLSDAHPFRAKLKMFSSASKKKKSEGV